MTQGLYQLVEEYANLGIHRTGTSVDRATVDWLASHLRARGAKVLRQDYSFDFFDAKTTVHLDGHEIPSMPLYYEAIGDIKTDNVAVAEFGNGDHGSGLDDSLEAMIDSAMSDGYDSLVIATHGETGNIVAINCEPKLRTRIPVVLVPGRYANALKTGAATVQYTAIIKPGISTNIIGHWGLSLTEPPFVITTPMTGWFTCAGERGTGIAVALHIAERLTQHMPHVPLKVIAPSGHELGFYGAYRIAESVNSPPTAVLHLGSCIAAYDAELRGIAHADPTTFDAIKKALAPLHIGPENPDNHLDPDCWVGESRCWARFGMPMLSIAGMSPTFHTPDDITETATTPALLKSFADCIGDAALALLQNYDYD